MQLVLGFICLSFLVYLETDAAVQHYHSLSADELNITYRKFVETQMDRYESGNYSFQEGVYYRIFTPGQKLEDIDLNGKALDYFVRKLMNHPNCIGLKTRGHQIIVLECAEKKQKKHGCFDIYSPAFVPEEEIFFIPDQKVDNVCVRILNKRCIGIITPSNWTLPFECTRKVKESVVVNTAVNIPYNAPPRQ